MPPHEPQNINIFSESLDIPQAPHNPFTIQATDPQSHDNVHTEGPIIQSNSNSNRSSNYFTTFKSQLAGRFVVCALVVICLEVGRHTVPDNEVPCALDLIQGRLGFANKFVNNEAHKTFAWVLQSAYSILIDGIFLSTLGYWILYGKNLRFPITLMLFYLTRMIFLYVWYVPNPEGYHWVDPGFPGLVLSYNQGAGFFFTKYTGMLVICAKEWKRSGHKLAYYIAMACNIYAIVVSLIFRSSYCIDLFTSVSFADWLFDKVDWTRASFDKKGAKGAVKEKHLMRMKSLDM